MQIDFSLIGDCSATLHIINPPGQPSTNSIAVQVIPGGTAFYRKSLDHGVESLGQYTCHFGQGIITLHEGVIRKYAGSANIDHKIIANVALIHAVAHAVIHLKHIDEKIWKALAAGDRIKNVALLATWLFLQLKNMPEVRLAFRRISDESPVSYQIWKSICEEEDWDFYKVRAEYRKMFLSESKPH